LTSFLGNQQTLTISNYNSIEPATISTSVQFPAGSGSTPTKPVPTPTKPVPTPTKPVTTPTIAPTGTKPTTTCQWGTVNEWWVEVVTGSGKTVEMFCNGQTQKNCACSWNADWSKYTCPIANTACTTKRWANINGACCAFDAGACSSAIVEDSSAVSNNGSLDTSVLIGIVAAAICFVGLLIFAFVFLRLKKPVEEHV